MDSDSIPEISTLINHELTDDTASSAIRAFLQSQILIGEDPSINCDQRNVEGETPLLQAVSSTLPQEIKIRFIRYLLFRGASPHSPNLHGATALHIAASNGDVSVIRILLEYGAYVNARDSELETPLHWAVKKAERTSVDMLIKHGALIDLANREGETPLSVALQIGNEELLCIMLTFGSRSSSFALSAAGKKQMKSLAGRLKKNTHLQKTRRVPFNTSRRAEDPSRKVAKGKSSLPWWWS